MSLTYPRVSYPFEFLWNQTKFNGIHKSRMGRKTKQKSKCTRCVLTLYFIIVICICLVLCVVFSLIFPCYNVMIRRGYILAQYCAGIQINNAIFHSPLDVCVRIVLLLPVGCFISNIINKSGKLNVKQFYSPLSPHSTKNKTCNCTSYISIIQLYVLSRKLLLFSSLPNEIELHPQDSCQVMTACVTNSSCSTCVFQIKESRTNCFVITFPWEEFECFASEN